MNSIYTYHESTSKTVTKLLKYDFENNKFDAKSFSLLRISLYMHYKKETPLGMTQTNQIDTKGQEQTIIRANNAAKHMRYEQIQA